MNALLRPNTKESTVAATQGFSEFVCDVMSVRTGNRVVVSLSVHGPVWSKESRLSWHGIRHHAIVLGLWSGNNLHVYSDWLPMWRRKP